MLSFAIGCAHDPCPTGTRFDGPLTAVVADLDGSVCLAPHREPGVDPERRFYLDATHDDARRRAWLRHLRVHVAHPDWSEADARRAVPAPGVH
jgi:hypothetical protein